MDRASVDRRSISTNHILPECFAHVQRKSIISGVVALVGLSDPIALSYCPPVVWIRTCVALDLPGSSQASPPPHACGGAVFHPCSDPMVLRWRSSSPSPFTSPSAPAFNGNHEQLSCPLRLP